MQCDTVILLTIGPLGCLSRGLERMRYRATDARLAQITERKSSRLQNRVVTFPALRSVGSDASVSLDKLSSNGCSSTPSSASTFPPGGAMFATATVSRPDKRTRGVRRRCWRGSQTGRSSARRAQPSLQSSSSNAWPPWVDLQLAQYSSRPLRVLKSPGI